MKYIKSFIDFWQDFLIGDAPEIFIGVAIILAAALIIHHVTVLSDIGIPLAILVLLTLSVARGRKS